MGRGSQITCGAPLSRQLISGLHQDRHTKEYEKNSIKSLRFTFSSSQNISRLRCVVNPLKQTSLISTAERLNDFCRADRNSIPSAWTWRQRVDRSLDHSLIAYWRKSCSKMPNRSDVDARNFVDRVVISQWFSGLDEGFDFENDSCLNTMSVEEVHIYIYCIPLKKSSRLWF